MSDSINTVSSYIQFGTAYNSTTKVLTDEIDIPVPNTLPSKNEFLVDASRNAIGSLIIQKIGRTQYTTSIGWNKLDAKMWWKINRWFDTNGYVFYMRYFSHTEGKVKVHRFYRGNINEGTPSSTTTIYDGVVSPTHYFGVGFSIIDMGDLVTVTEKTIPI